MSITSICQPVHMFSKKGISVGRGLSNNFSGSCVEPIVRSKHHATTLADERPRNMCRVVTDWPVLIDVIDFPIGLSG